MGKIKTSRKRKTSSLNISSKSAPLRIKKGVKIKKFDPDKYLSKDFIGAAIMECLLNNDPEGIIELLNIYLSEHNKTEIFKEAKISRSTAYQAFRHRNPTLRTLAKIISTAAAH